MTDGTVGGIGGTVCYRPVMSYEHDDCVQQAHHIDSQVGIKLLKSTGCHERTNLTPPEK